MRTRSPPAPGTPRGCSPDVPSLIDTRTIACPHCGEEIEIVIDASEPTQSYIEDCSVCCQPMTVSYRAEDGELAELNVEAAG
jgi:cysteine-rich CPXCG protein